MPLPEPSPDLVSLDLLQSVAELGSISRAAAAHRVSQPAASMRLRSLEKLVGLPLLDRATTGARLTPAGTAIAHWAEPVLAGMRSLVAGTNALRLDASTQLRIAASMTVAEYLVPTWLTRLRGCVPEVAVSLQMGNSEHVVDLMRKGEVDVGFVEGHAIPADLRWRTVVHDELAVVVTPAHPWAARKRPVRPDELARTPLVVREHGSGTREVLERALSAYRLVPTVGVELGSTTAIKTAVLSGAGPAGLSRLVIGTELADGRLRTVPLEGLDLTRSIRAVWLPGRPLSPPAARLLREIGTAAPRRNPRAPASP